MSYSETITKADLENVLNEVLPFGYDDDIVKVEKFQISTITISANGTYTNTAIDVSAHIPNGYKLVDVDCTATGSNVIYCYQAGKDSDTTAVLQLRNISSSAITITPMLKTTCIKQEYANVGAKQADYIVEQGTSDIWTYRKWNSGISECWGTVSWSITSWSSWGSTYYSTYSSQVDYPTGLFTNAPKRLTGNDLSNGDSWLGTQNNGTASKTPKFFLMRGANGTSGTGYVAVHAIGTWK